MGIAMEFCKDCIGTIVSHNGAGGITLIIDVSLLVKYVYLSQPNPFPWFVRWEIMALRHQHGISFALYIHESSQPPRLHGIHPSEAFRRTRQTLVQIRISARLLDHVIGRRAS